MFHFRGSRLILAAGTAVLALVVALAVFALLPYPELDRFRGQRWSTRILDRGGTILDILPAPDGMRREFVDIDAIPAAVKTIFLNSEDRRFRFHPGIDPVAALRSLALNAKAGRVVSGASTITMQLARIISSRGSGARKKLAEIADAFKLEARLSKNAILELYLNTIPFASMVEGVPSAARYFFGKSLDELDPEEICVLAVIPRRPALYNPLTDPVASGRAAAALARSGGIPAALFRDRSDETFIAVARSAAKSAAKGSRNSFSSSAAVHVPHFIRRYIASDPAVRGRPELRTSIDSAVQKTLEDSIRRQVAANMKYRMTNGAGIVLDNSSGGILAYAGSNDFDDGPNRGQIDGVRTLNQPGSCLKPFLYACAMGKGFLPTTILPDVPTDFGGTEVYVPLNFNNRFNGPVRLRVALASSLNVPAVYTLDKIGVPVFVDFLQKAGFDSVKGQAENAGVGLALGNAEVSLFELVQGFAVFPRGGLTLTARPFAADVPAKGSASPATVSSAAVSSAHRLMSPYIAAEICDILSDQPSRFAGFAHGRLMATDYAAMFKTGTANQFQHVWALGATPDYTAGIWMGNFTGETLAGKRSSGVPAAVVVDVLDSIAKPDSRFPLPPDSEKVVICAVSGKKAGPACPGTVPEYLPRGFSPDECDVHRALSVRAGQTRAAATPGGVVFLHPRDGAEFYLDPSIPPEDQALGIEIAGLAGTRNARVFANGKFLGAMPGSGRLLWPLQRGRFRLSVTENGAEAASATITVR